MANYSATITGHGLAVSKEKRTPSVKLSLKAHNDLDSGEACDKTFYADLWLSDNAAERTARTLRAIGWNGMDAAELNDGQTLVGIEVEISTEFEDYNGESREKVKFVNEAGNFAKRGVKPLDDNAARAIVSKFNALLKNTPRNAQKPAPKAGRVDTVQYASPDDDFPF